MRVLKFSCSQFSETQEHGRLVQLALVISDTDISKYLLILKNIVWAYFLTLAHLYEYTGAPVVQWFKRWPTDLAD